MGIIADTCVFIRAERKQKFFQFSDEQQDQAVYISAITVSELLLGVHRAKDEAIRLKRSTFVESILQDIPIIPFDPLIARVHAEIHAILMDQGNMIGPHDLMIAATALSRSYAVLTSNAKEFSRVPGLQVLALA